MRRSRLNLMLVSALSLLATLPCGAADRATDLDERPHIDVVFAIDCSGSMGGVIETAKQKIWGIVNEIAKAKPSPVLRIGLHGYGNAERTYRNYSLTDDLDQVYADLMTFKDEGWSEEYVGLSIQKTLKEMDWKDWEKSGASNVLRVLYVVGNETAEQGPVSYKTSAPAALKNQIYVNAIYCGWSGGPRNVTNPPIKTPANPPANPASSSSSRRMPTPQQMAATATMLAMPPGQPSSQAGNAAPQAQNANPAPNAVQKQASQQAPRMASIASPDRLGEIETWREMAQLGGGEFSQIAASGGGVTIPTPYDKDFTALNARLNDTYVAYGARGDALKGRQTLQDSNAMAVGGTANLAARAQAKSSAQYNNRGWDLVDASKEKDFDLAKIPKDQLPAEMRNLSLDEQKKFIAQKDRERSTLQKQIGELGRKREDYIQAELKKKNISLDQALDEQILRSIRTQATKRGFRF